MKTDCSKPCQNEKVIIMNVFIHFQASTLAKISWILSACPLSLYRVSEVTKIIGMKKNFVLLASFCKVLIKIAHKNFKISVTSDSNRFCLFSIFFISHCQTTMTCHPFFFNVSIFRLSLNWVSFIFFSQNSFLVSGSFDALHPRCPCQKHPWMKMTILDLGKTISGLPGYLRSFIRYLNPFENRNFLTKISGFVSFPEILDMISLLFFFG